MKFCSLLFIFHNNIINIKSFLFSSEKEEESEEVESEASETTASPHGELWCKKTGRMVGISAHLKPLMFLIIDYMHLMYQLHLEPTKAAKTVFSSSGSWIKGQKKRHFMLSICWSLLLFSSVLPTCCLYLLYGFKIKGVSIKVNYVELS